MAGFRLMEVIMRKIKRMLTQVLVGVMICLLASPYIASAASQQSEAVNLEQAIDLATNKSTAVTLIDQKIKNAQSRLDYAIRNASIRLNDSWTTDEYRKQLKTDIELAPVQKRNTFLVLKLQKAEKINSLKMDVTKAYFTYLMIQEQLTSQDKAIERLKKKLEVVNAQVASGMANKSAISNMEVAIKSAEQQKAMFARDLSNTSINLNSLWDRPIKSPIELISQEIPVLELDIKLEELIDKKIASSSAVLRALNTEAEAKIEYNITNFSSIKEMPDGVEQAENKLLNASYDYKNLLKNMEYNVLNDYNNLLNLKDDVDIKKLQVEVSEKELKKAKAEYDMGLTDIITYNSKIQSNEDSIIGYKKAQLDYFIAAVVFKN